MLQGKKYWWKLPNHNDNTVAAIASRYNISYSVAQILLSRGIDQTDDIDQFLFSSFETSVNDAALLKDATKAVDRLLSAIQTKEPILVFGDYDVDGITSSAMMMACLLPLGANINFFLPNRIRDGYGISTKIVNRAADNGYKVIVTVDNGITAFEPAQRAKERGIDLIITDHHRVHGTVPDAYAVVNPHQPDCQYPFKFFAGVGVTFKILSLLYERKKIVMPSKAYELLLLGTVADVVPLTKENRFWVRYGLNYVNRHKSLSFDTLCKNGNISKPLVSSMDIGFSIAPQINALGRLEDPRQGVKFLLDSSEQEVEDVGRTLLELNEKRKAVERSIVQEIEKEIASKKIDLDGENIIMAASSSWPAGVIGLVASRFVSKYGKPALLFHKSGDGIVKGSCRSIKEFNMFEALQENKEILIQFGGHAQAAGLSLKEDNLPLLKENLEKRIAEQLEPEDLYQKIQLDSYLSLSEVNKKLITDMAYLEPFGHENASPLFYCESVTLIQEPKLLKDAHVKCSIFADGAIKPVIFFNRPELFEALLHLKNRPFALAAQVTENYWRSRSNVELIGIDIAEKQDEQ